MTRKIRCYANCTEKQKAFVDNMARGYLDKNGRKNPITKREAYVAAGYADSCATSSAHDLHLRLREVIEDRRKELVSDGLVPTMAIDVINSIMMDTEASNKDRMDAAKDILRRSGFDKPQEIVTTTKVENLDELNLDEELEELMGKAGNVRSIKSA